MAAAASSGSPDPGLAEPTSPVRTAKDLASRQGAKTSSLYRFVDFFKIIFWGSMQYVGK
jgi:hypothetical protein